MCGLLSLLGWRGELWQQQEHPKCLIDSIQEEMCSGALWVDHQGFCSGRVATFVCLAHVFSCKFSHTIRDSRRSLCHITMALLTSTPFWMSFLVDFFPANLPTSPRYSSRVTLRADKTLRILMKRLLEHLVWVSASSASDHEKIVLDNYTYNHFIFYN